MKTVPAGFWGVPPVGPAMPVMPMPKSALASFLTFCAMRRATSFETAPFLRIVEEEMPKIAFLAWLL